MKVSSKGSQKDRRFIHEQLARWLGQMVKKTYITATTYEKSSIWNGENPAPGFGVSDTRVPYFNINTRACKWEYIP